MKILYALHQYYPEYQAGTEKFVYNMASMSELNANKVKIVTYRLGDFNHPVKSAEGIQYEEYFHNKLQVVAFQYNAQPVDLNFGFDNALGLAFARDILKKEKPDILHIGHMMRVFPFAQAAIELDISFVITLTDFFMICPRNTLAPTPNSLCNGPKGGEACAKYCPAFSQAYIQERLAQAKSILQKAAKIFAPSRFVAQMVEAEVDGIEVIVNHHGIRQSQIRANTRHYDQDSQLNFGFIGTLSNHKGTHLAIQAFEKLNTEKASLSVYGSGEEDYVKWLKRLAGKSQTHFLGAFPSEDLAKIFSTIDVLIVPSIVYETYSFVVHEALACEVPVIVSNLGGMVEQIEDELNSFLFPPGDVQALSEIMQSIVDNPDSLNEIKAQIRKTTLVPSIEQEAYQYQRVYQQIIRNANSI